MRLIGTVRAFLQRPSTDTWLTLLRVGIGLHVVLSTFALQDSWNLFLSGSGNALITREFGEAMVSAQSRLIPRMQSLLSGGALLGLSEQTSLLLVWLATVVAGCALIAGLFCRTAAVTAWLLHLCVAKSSGVLSYGVDNLATIALFYLMLSPLPDCRALDATLWPRRAVDGVLVGMFRRVLQLHLCIIYFFGGFTKALGSGWWNGENMWRALTRPPFDVLPTEMVASWHAVLPALGISVWLIELLYPVLIWPRKTRLLWLVLICGMHFGIGFAMGMHLFAVVMIVLNVAAFGPADTSPTTADTPPQPPPA